MGAPPHSRCKHKAAAPPSPTPSFSAIGAPGGGVDAEASGEESLHTPDVLYKLCDGAYGKETPPMAWHRVEEVAG